MQQHMAERLRLDDQTNKVTAANSGLTKKLSDSAEPETTLRRTQEQLEDGIDALTKKFARVEAKLEKEIVEHGQLMYNSVQLASVQVELKGALDERRKIEENLRRSETELATQVKTKAAEFRSEVFSCQFNAEGVPNSTIFNGIDALSLLRNQALAGERRNCQQ
jgi:chromosome segregation ATPase